MRNLPYSLDLSPNDFFLFPYVKNKMRGERFSTPEETIDAFRMHVSEISHSGIDLKEKAFLLRFYDIYLCKLK